MGKTCPKCGEYVSCKRWMYATKMCRKCDGRRRYKIMKLEQNKKTKLKPLK